MNYQIDMVYIDGSGRKGVKCDMEVSGRKGVKWHLDVPERKGVKCVLVIFQEKHFKLFFTIHPIGNSRALFSSYTWLAHPLIWLDQNMHENGYSQLKVLNSSLPSMYTFTYFTHQWVCEKLCQSWKSIEKNKKYSKSSVGIFVL